MPRKAKTPDFEQNLSQLEALVTQLEQGDLSLQESLTAFEQGIKLTRECQQTLEQAEQQVKVLLETKDGETRSVPLDQDSTP